MKRRKRNREEHRRFAEFVIRAVAKAGIHGVIQFDPKNFQLLLRSADGHPRYFELSQLHAAHRAGPPARWASVLQKALFSIAVRLEVPDEISGDEGRRRLLPRLRPRVYYECPHQTREQSSRPPVTKPYQLLAEHLAVGLVCDYPHAVVDVDEEMLGAGGSTPRKPSSLRPAIFEPVVTSRSGRRLAVSSCLPGATAMMPPGSVSPTWFGSMKSVAPTLSACRTPI